MQYKLKSLIKNNYLCTVLKERGIEDPFRYISPASSDIESWKNLDNVSRGADMLLKHLGNDEKIALIVDCDCDGYTSSAIIYNFIKAIFPTTDITFKVHEGKQHGLEDMIDYLQDNYFNLVIIPDAGSNDFEYQKILNEQGTDCLILDHHSVDYIAEEYYNNNEHTIIVNNQLSKNYLNKDLSGAGVTWQFCCGVEEALELDINDYITPELMDLAAVGIIGDCMNMLGIENRAFSYFGLHNIYNPFLKSIVEKQSFSLKRKEDISPTGVSFSIAPLINSIVRVGSYEEKIKMFEAFIDGTKVVPSTKRGAKGEMETLGDQMARECLNAKNRQDTAIEKAMNSLDMTIQSEGLAEDNTVIIANADDLNFPSTLNGLVAMKLTDKYKKPVLVVRSNSDGFLRGSARNDATGEFKDFRHFLLDSGFFEYAQGHDNAFGVSINNKSVDNFISYANEKLKNINFNDNFYEVEFVLSAKDDDLKDIIFDVYQDDRLWGQKNNAPLICVTNLYLSKSNIQVCGARKDTLRFTYNGITYIKFFATKDIEKLMNYTAEEFTITIIGEGALNEWCGSTYPQIMIKDYEIGGTIFDF